MSRNAKDLAVALVNSFGDVDAVLGLLTEDAQWWITPAAGVLGSPCVGRGEIEKSMRQIFGSFYQDVSVDVHVAICDGDLASVRFEMNATALFAGGKPYKNEYCVWVRACGDRIDRVWEYLDTGQSVAQFAGDLEAPDASS